MTTRLFITCLAILLPVVAGAGTIRQRPYGYAFDAAKAAESDTFVVCAHSPDDRITVLPAPPQLALRLGRDEIRTETAEIAAPAVIRTGRDCIACLLETVYFPFDSAALSNGERAKLDALSRDIPAGSGVSVAGYTCDLGSASHNLDLSLRRAKMVASYLRGNHVAVVNVEGKGVCCPVSDDRRLNRRAEITIQKGEEK